MSPEERQAVVAALVPEYGLLMGALGAAWSASLVRTSLFLGVLSAAGVGLGFAAQGGVDRASFSALVLIVMPLVLLLGIATFIRLVQVQREAVVYITGLNRIRHVLQESAPASRPYFVLPAHDDEAALYRSVGTGMSVRPPRYPLLHLVVQTQGIVGIVTGVVAAAIAGIALAPVDLRVAWLASAVAFVATVGSLFTYWQRSLRDLRSGIRTLFPTPPDELDAPF